MSCCFLGQLCVDFVVEQYLDLALLAEVLDRGGIFFDSAYHALNASIDINILWSAVDAPVGRDFLQGKEPKSTLWRLVLSTFARSIGEAVYGRGTVKCVFGETDWEG